MAGKALRVLHVIARTNRGGAESRIMDLYREMDRDRIQFDFLVHAEAGETGKRSPSSDELMAVRPEGDLDEEILSMGGRIYAVPRLNISPSKTDFFAYRRAVGNFFKEHADEWRVVQGHMTSTSAVYLAAARRFGVPVTIAHARSAGVDPGLKGVLTRLMRLPLSVGNRHVRVDGGYSAEAVDYRFACSKEAAAAVFGRRPAIIIPNAIRVDSFRYSAKERAKIREELGLGDRRVVGHVGTFRYAKNHEFLIKTFARLKESAPEGDYCLLLVGRGEELEASRRLVSDLSLGDSVIFAGVRDDIRRIYQAIDVFAFPSRYEGLPGSVLEAQAAALPCLISDRITDEVDVTSLVRRESIGDDRDMESIERAQDKWAAALLELFAKMRPGAREDISEQAAERLKAAGFDVSAQAKMLTRFYETGEGLPAPEVPE